MEGDTGHVGLPAARGVLADPQRPGYLADPDGAHLAASANALAGIAEAVTASMPSSGTPVDVTVHTAVNSFASPLLYLFALAPVAEDGAFFSGVSESEPVHVAIVANQPVNLQVEATLSFLAQLLERQEQLKGIAGSDEFHQLDIQMQAADAKGHAETSEGLRHGWAETARRLGARARQASIQLRVSYRPDFVQTVSQVERRGPLLRRAYNELGMVRESIDRITSMIAVRESRIEGGSESIRRRLQLSYSLSGSPQYFAQAIRDSLVLGNGFIAFTDVEPFGPYNIHPEEVEPVADRAVRHRSSERIQDDVLHFTGMDQPTSLLGLGLCELALMDLRRRDAFSAAIRNMGQFVDRHPEATDQIRTYEEMARQHDEEWSARFERTLWSVVPSLEAPPPDLYFEGQERL